MAFGVIFDFAANSNATKITKAVDLVKEDWFYKAVNYNSETPIDLFVILGHNPIRGNISTFGPVYDMIRSLRPDIPIQFFGGHTHIRLLLLSVVVFLPETNGSQRFYRL